MKAKDKMLVKHLALTADLSNTTNGGMALPQISIAKQSNRWILKVQLPGVSIENIKLELKDSYLFMFQLIQTEPEAQMPYLVSAIWLDASVNMDNITAEYTGGRLMIYLPQNAETKHDAREIAIQKK